MHERPYVWREGPLEGRADRIELTRIEVDSGFWEFLEVKMVVIADA